MGRCKIRRIRARTRLLRSGLGDFPLALVRGGWCKHSTLTQHEMAYIPQPTLELCAHRTQGTGVLWELRMNISRTCCSFPMAPRWSSARVASALPLFPKHSPENATPPRSTSSENARLCAFFSPSISTRQNYDKHLLIGYGIYFIPRFASPCKRRRAVGQGSGVSRGSGFIIPDDHSNMLI